MERINRQNNVVANGSLHVPTRNLKPLSTQQRQDRLNYARANLNRDWSNVIFSDEKFYQSDHGIWGWIGREGPGEMTFISGRMNSANYTEILEDVLIPSVETVYEDMNNVIFMQLQREIFVNYFQPFEVKANIKSKPLPIRSTILGQRKPKTNKRKMKKRTTERRYSEGEASDYDENNKSCGESDTNGEKNVIPDQRDSGVDFGGDSGDDNSKKSTQKNSKNNRSYKKAN